MRRRERSSRTRRMMRRGATTMRMRTRRMRKGKGKRWSLMTRIKVRLVVEGIVAVMLCLPFFHVYVVMCADDGREIRYEDFWGEEDGEEGDGGEGDQDEEEVDGEEDSGVGQRQGKGKKRQLLGGPGSDGEALSASEGFGVEGGLSLMWGVVVWRQTRGLSRRRRTRAS
jgi:hypothetical protein